MRRLDGVTPARGGRDPVQVWSQKELYLYLYLYRHKALASSRTIALVLNVDAHDFVGSVGCCYQCVGGWGGARACECMSQPHSRFGHVWFALQVRCMQHGIWRTVSLSESERA